MSEKPIIYVAAIRLNPMIPTGVVNYLFGMSSLNVKTYILASAVFFLPGGFAFALAGTEFGALIGSSGQQEFLFPIVVFLLATSMLITGFIISKFINKKNRFVSVSEIKNKNI